MIASMHSVYGEKIMSLPRLLMTAENIGFMQISRNPAGASSQDESKFEALQALGSDPSVGPPFVQLFSLIPTHSNAPMH